MNSSKCPQCQRDINEFTNRLIQDTCGHKKCRTCLLQDETTCKTCKEVSELKNTSASTSTPCNISVIKYETKSLLGLPTQTTSCTKEGPKQSVMSPQPAAEATKKTERCDYKRNLIRRAFTIPAHITIVTKIPILYKCTVCLKTFSTNASVKYHMYCGGVEKPLKCDICNKRFISKSHLETHKLRHSGARPFVCTLCQKSFTQKSKLNRHMKIHTGDKPFVCSECGKKFTNKDALNGHYRIHDGLKPYLCKQCGNRFNNKSNLTKHLLIHSKDKLYICEECGKKISNKWALISHRKCHSRERPYSCQKCSRNFTNLKDLRRHGIIHLAVKPYGCKKCNTKFCRKDNLKRHLKNTHSMESETEIKSATIKYTVNTKLVDTITSSKDQREPDSSKLKSTQTVTEKTTVQDNPNAIHVIKASKTSETSTQPYNNNIVPSVRNTVPVINGPFKLAFKTDAFRSNYNILNKNYTEPPPRIQTKKPYDMVESLNICQKILSPMNASIKTQLDCMKDSPVDKPKNVIMSVGNVNEKESLEICKKILAPNDPPDYAVIRNMKFKLPSTYTTTIKSETTFDLVTSNFQQETVTRVSSPVESKTNTTVEYTELQPMKPYVEDNTADCVNKQSVIVNPHSSDATHSYKPSNTVPFNEMHWRKRTSQILQPRINNS